MAPILGQGNFINGSFISGGTITFTSKNPSANYEEVFQITTDLAHVDLAVNAARKAYKTWNYLSINQRKQALLTLKSAFIKHEETMAKAISQEMGKIYSEALTESKSLSARIDLILEHGLKRVSTESLYNLRAETRYHSQGVLAVIGPYNFPAHLVNAHVIPSIVLGNTVVIKPSEICPKVAETYAQCVKESSIPNGVVNIVQGEKSIGQALSTHPEIDGVLFTGSYRTGRALQEALLDQPHKILALEMGGKNFAIVMDDADLKQAVLEIILGGFLTTGQRCTATSRVLVHDSYYDKFKKAILHVTKTLKPFPLYENGMFGPMATKQALEHFLNGLRYAKNEGANPLLESEVLPGGAFVTPSVYEISSSHAMEYYLTEELFGPNICLESFCHFDDAIARVNQSPYGLSNAIFTSTPSHYERLINETKSGVLNINRSTNNAFGQMPFGGVNKSGNQRPAGIDAVRYATFPMAVSYLPYGDSQASKHLKNQIGKEREIVKELLKRHRVEAAFETFGIFCDSAAHGQIVFNKKSFGLANFAQFNGDLCRLFPGIEAYGDFITVKTTGFDPTKFDVLYQLLQVFAESNGGSLSATKKHNVNIPENLELPRSRAMLDRLYKDDFVPREKKTLVPDLLHTRGPYLHSIDENPLVIIDAASQIATVGAGFLADTFQNAYDANQFDLALLKNTDLNLNADPTSSYVADAQQAKKDFENFLHEKSDHCFGSIAYGASGAEANEIAFDICRQNGPGGTKILAFEGSFHGRTIMALQATYNKEKRGPFSFSGYEASFLPFPELKDPRQNPPMPKDFLKSLALAKIPVHIDGDDLLKRELESLKALKNEAEKGNICAVIIEPMQCEGGDKYASPRFFSGLRVLTRALGLPLIFDEVQTGFHLGRSFFWYQMLNLIDQDGNQEVPDCITLAKKAQLGVCLSVWQKKRAYNPHIIQLKRGLLHGKALSSEKALVIEDKVTIELNKLKEHFSGLVLFPRACGFAFAFDMPTKELATELIDQRFNYGFMAYIAGEKTIRFRLNMAMSKCHIEQLFEKLFIALIDLRDKTVTRRNNKLIACPTNLTSYSFENLTETNFPQFEQKIAAIENNAYEPGRRDTMDYLRAWLKQKDSVGILMVCEQDIIGYAIGGPLEFATADGPNEDTERNKHNTFYSANITIAERFRGMGFGTLLKSEQIKRTASIRRDDGSARYLYMTGRNRVDLASAMSHINDNLGAYLVKTYDNQYGEKDAQASYYRLLLQKAQHPIMPLQQKKMLDCTNSLEHLFNRVPDSLMEALHRNELRSITGSKLTLSNWATPAMVRYSELLRSVMPLHLNHAYFTSGRDEIVDKGLRSLRFHRPQADIAIGFSHQWLGVNSAAARSLSHNEHQQEPFSFFNWPKIPHPALVGNHSSLKALKDVLFGIRSDKVLGIVVELMGEMSGFTFNNEFLHELDTIRKDTGIPLVFIENASSYFRSGEGLFLSDHLPVKANMVLWFTGGQLGHIFCDDSYFVDKPLTLISTWDGDEISMVRAYHHLIYATEQNKTRMKQFEESLFACFPGNNHSGRGMWHAIKFKDHTQLENALVFGRENNIIFGQGFNNSLMVCPKIDCSSEELEAIITVVKIINDKLKA